MREQYLTSVNGKVQFYFKDQELITITYEYLDTLNYLLKFTAGTTSPISFRDKNTFYCRDQTI